MEEQVRRLSAHYGWNLSEEEIRRIAAEAAVQDQVLDRLHRVKLAQTRPIMGVFKSRRAADTSKRRQI